MEKRVILAIILSVLVLILYRWLFVKPQEPTDQGAAQKTAQVIEKPKDTETTQKKEELKVPTQLKEDEEIQKIEGKLIEDQLENICQVETDIFSVRFTNRGARVRSWQLKKYQDDEGEPLELVSHKMAAKDLLPLSIFIQDNQKLSSEINSALFMTNTRNLKLGNRNNKGVLTFQYSNDKGLNLIKKFTFYNSSYVVSVELKSSSPKMLKNGYILMGPDIGNEPYTTKKSFFSAPKAVVQSFLSLNGKVSRIKSLDIDEAKKSVASQTYPGMIDFVGLENNYFASIFLPPHTIEQGIIVQREVVVPDKDEEDVIRYALSSGIPIAAQPEGVGLFVGPKDLKLLDQINPKLESVVDFGIFSFIAKPLLFGLQAINKYVHNYGFSIIILTVIIKILFHPLTRKSYRSMKKMQALQPKMNAIKDKYKKAKKDPALKQKMNQEIMALYRKEGVSPMGGCLPMLLQLPVLFAFYKILYVSIEIRHAPFIWWITDLSKKDPYYITPIIMGITMLIQQRSTPTTGDPSQAKMLKLMPVFFTFLFLSFPSGLVLYWLVNNLITIGEQRLINIKENKGTAGGRKESKAKSKEKKRSK